MIKKPVICNAFKKSDGLTIRMIRFAEIFIGDRKAAAIEAGYKPAGASAVGSRLLKNPKIVELIKSREQIGTRILIMNREKRQEFWSKVANSEDNEMRDRLRASELLGKSEGDFFDRIVIEDGRKLADFTPAELSRISVGENVAKIIDERKIIECEDISE